MHDAMTTPPPLTDQFRLEREFHSDLSCSVPLLVELALGANFFFPSILFGLMRIFRATEK